jgi:hypothetical protein
VKFAEGTTVAPEKTRAEIETVVRRYGAQEFASGWNGSTASIQFQAHGRRVRFSLAMPDEAWARKNRKGVKALVELVAAEERRRWRCLLLAIKAKLEIVSTGIAAFEEEFLAHIVRDDGRTVYESIIAAAVNGRPLLPAVTP